MSFLRHLPRAKLPAALALERIRLGCWRVARLGRWSNLEGKKTQAQSKQQADKRVAPVSRCLVHSCPQCVMRFADCVMKRSFRKGGFVGAKGALWRLGRLARWPTILFRARVRHKLAKANEWQSGEPPQPPSLKCYLSTNVLPVWARDRGGTTCALQRKSFC